MNYTRVNNSNADYVDGFGLVKSVDKKLTSKGDPYLDFILTDNTGEIIAKLWQYNECEHGEFKPLELVKFRGYLQEYNGATQLKIERIREISATDNINIADYIKCAPRDAQDMYNEIAETVNTINDTTIKAIITAIYKDNYQYILSCPAARSMHHNVRSGLLQHTTDMLKVAKSLAIIYPQVNTDYLFAGVILHDIAKIREFGYDKAELGIVDDYSKEGKLIGHLVLGVLELESYTKDIPNISFDTVMVLQHMLISHHGKPEWGAAVKPMTLEAELLSRIDAMDAAVYEITAATENLASGEFSGKVFALENRQFFKA